MAKSTHKVEVVPIYLETHPNADTLSIVRVWGYTCVVRTEDFRGASIAAYLPPDSVVPPTPLFAFLGDKRRIRVRKFRGVVSQGLLIQAPEGSKAGDDVAQLLGITRYEPPLDLRSSGEVESPPPLTVPEYDVEDWHRYGHFFRDGEEVVALEKIHGANGRFVFVEGRFWVGSRKEWKKEDPRTPWWHALSGSPWLDTFCRTHPGLVVFGEAYGKVQELRYGIPNEVRVAVFDLWDGARFLPYDEARGLGKDLEWVPELYRGPYDAKLLKELSNGPSKIPTAKHPREGIVVRPIAERGELEIGRVQLKIVSDEYMEKAK